MKTQEFGKAIHAFGSVVPETRREYIVAVRTSGWIADLKTDAIGDTVKKGDLLFTYYSQDLMAAQSDYLLGSRVGDPGQRLRLYSMNEKAI
ncbi:MAG: efflux RND transporter periplasmic adaptor subunit, partial [candidate division Zixibacteria bacterium]|nr:efflux RND transporter periplasmic adaptor subunit [candidate division Zixibacteria bacterium]